MIDVGLPISTRTIFRAALWLAVWPILALLGAAVSGAAIYTLVRRVLRLRSIKLNALICPAQHAVNTKGRWKCARCGGQFVGWVGLRCPVCGDDSAEWMSCDECGLAITFPWRSPT